MSIIGKRIIIPGADFSDIAVRKYVRRSIPLISYCATYDINTGEISIGVRYRATTYADFKAGDIIHIKNQSALDNSMQVFELASGIPEFADGTRPSVQSSGSLIRGYEKEDFLVEKDGRYLAMVRDDNDTDNSTDFTPYNFFGLFNFSREYVVGKATPIHAYYGAYNATDSTFELADANNIRAFAMLDVKIGDEIETANSDLGLLVLKMQDGTSHTYEDTLLADYADTKWTSKANQRVLVVAKSYSHPNSKVAEDLNAIFKVTFDS